MQLLRVFDELPAVLQCERIKVVCNVHPVVSKLENFYLSVESPIVPEQTRAKRNLSLCVVFADANLALFFSLDESYYPEHMHVVGKRAIRVF